MSTSRGKKKERSEVVMWTLRFWFCRPCYEKPTKRMIGSINVQTEMSPKSMINICNKNPTNELRPIWIAIYRIWLISNSINRLKDIYVSVLTMFICKRFICEWSHITLKNYLIFSLYFPSKLNKFLINIWLFSHGK